MKERAELGRLGQELGRLLGWPPVAPSQVRALHLTADDPPPGDPTPGDPTPGDPTPGGGLAAGLAEADALADSGVDLVLLEADGDPLAAIVAVAVLLDLEPVVAVGTDPFPGWAEQVVAVRSRLPAARQLVREPARLVEDPLLGRLTGLLEGCAARRTPVVLGGGVLVAAAALVAYERAPDAPRWWLAGQRPTSAAGRAAHRRLGLEPLLDIGVTTGGPQLTLGLLRGGVEVVHG